jgi:hypothetical protein
MSGDSWFFKSLDERLKSLCTGSQAAAGNSRGGGAGRFVAYGIGIRLRDVFPGTAKTSYASRNRWLSKERRMLLGASLEN